jgi:hypothetical protein
MLIPGVAVMIFFARRVRAELGLQRKERVSGPSLGTLPEELLGIAALTALLVLWPLALAFNRHVTAFLSQHPWRILRTK